MPARPGARYRPKRDRHSIVPAGSLGCQPSDTHSTRHHLDQSPHPGCDKVAPAHSKALDCSLGPAQVPGPAMGSHLGSEGQTGSRSSAALERDGGIAPPGSLPPVGTV
eukprot:5750436-Amphidinium_carterae.1